jgi:hypothetical protein
LIGGKAMNATLSISCDINVYKDFYRIADRKSKDKTNGDILAEMIEAYKAVKAEKTEAN